jgi:hypothetical protein
VSNAAIEIYHAGWIICFTVAAALFYGINVLFPPQIYPEGLQSTVPMMFEGLADTEGYLEGESVITFITSEGDEARKVDKV